MSVFYDLNNTPRNILNKAIVKAIVAESNGAWFDPSDLSTLYQDAAGTIPVTAVEQPVGLMLDKSRGLMLGPELVSNGTFDSDMSSWSQNNTAPATITSIGGVATWNTSSGGVGRLVQEFNTVAGKSYKITYEILSSSGGSVTTTIYDINSSTDIVVYSSAAVGKYSRVFIAKGAITRFQLATANYPYTADNFSVRELYGNHATQSITASRPRLSARKNILLATEALATQSVTTLAATYTLSFTGTGSVTLSGTATGTLTGTGTDRVSLTFTSTAGTLTLTVSGSVTKAQLGFGSVVTSYQRVTTANDYDVSAHYYYLRFDGVDDHFNLPYMGLYAGGNASVLMSLAHFGPDGVYERVFAEANPSSPALYLPFYGSIDGLNLHSGIVNDGADQFFESPLVATKATTFTLGFVDSGSNIKMYFNSAITNDTVYSRTDQPMTLSNTSIGGTISQLGSSNAKMNLYGLLITKSALSDAQRIQCERLLARKAGVTL